MGIHNRDYIRDEPPRPMQTSGGFQQDGWAVKWIIGVCVATYFLQSATGQVIVDPRDGSQFLRGGVTDLFSLSFQDLRNFQFWRLLTSGLCHADIRHLLFNMIGIWVFGRMAESVYGSKETLAFFLVADALSGFAHVMTSHGSVIGASGGVYALLALGAMNFPRAPMQLMFIPVNIELRWIAVGYGVFGFLQGGNIAHAAHLGGAVVGVLYFLSGIRLLPQGRQFGYQTRNSSGFSFAGLLARLKPRRKPDPRRAPEVKLYEPPAEQLEREMDRVLDKINREGKDSLTPEENEILMKASESYRNRV